MSNPTTAAKGKVPLAGSSTNKGIVVLKVGPDAEEHHVHKALLIYHSEYFQKALTGPWKEAQGQAITLQDVDSKTFCIFVHWLYAQGLPQNPDGWLRLLISDGLLDPGPFWEDSLMEDLVKAYVFADRFVAPGFRRAVNNASANLNMSRYYFDADGRSSTAHAFDNISAKQVLLQRLVDLYCINLSERDHDFNADTLDMFPMTFLRRVMIRLKEMGSKPGNAGTKRCYLEHASEEEKTNCRSLHMRYDEDYDYAYFE